jgi:hypothetical protein
MWQQRQRTAERKEEFQLIALRCCAMSCWQKLVHFLQSSSMRLYRTCACVWVPKVAYTVYAFVYNSYSSTFVHNSYSSTMHCMPECRSVYPAHVPGQQAGCCCHSTCHLQPPATSCLSACQPVAAEPGLRRVYVCHPCHACHPEFCKFELWFELHMTRAQHAWHVPVWYGHKEPSKISTC